MTNSEYEELGINPNSRDHGYECKHCGDVPTQRELDNGTRCACQRSVGKENNVVLNLK